MIQIFYIMRRLYLASPRTINIVVLRQFIGAPKYMVFPGKLSFRKNTCHFTSKHILLKLHVGHSEEWDGIAFLGQKTRQNREVFVRCCSDACSLKTTGGP